MKNAHCWIVALRPPGLPQPAPLPAPPAEKTSHNRTTRGSGAVDRLRRGMHQFQPAVRALRRLAFPHVCPPPHPRRPHPLTQARNPSRQLTYHGRGGSSGRGSFYQTTAIKDTQTVGTASNDCSDMFFLWSDMIYFGIKHDMSILPLRERFATLRQAGAIAWLRLDAVLAHAEAQSLLQVKTS